MAMLEIGPVDGLSYAYTPPSVEDGLTFVGFNTLTGDLSNWETGVGEALRAAGHGTLWYNYRGQAGSPIGPEMAVSEQQIVDDAKQLLDALQPPRPVGVGYSVGGVYAVRARERGVPFVALVFVNTLRRPSAHLSWLNANLTRAAEVGGMDLVKELYLPFLTNDDWQAANMAAIVGRGDYTPIDRESGLYRLLKSGERVDWDLPYETLTLPVLNVTGLQDRMFLNRDDVAALLARLPDARAVEMPEAGHLIPMEQPRALAGHLLAFAEEVRG